MAGFERQMGQLFTGPGAPAKAPSRRARSPQLPTQVGTYGSLQLTRETIKRVINLMKTVLDSGGLTLNLEGLSHGDLHEVNRNIKRVICR